MNYGAMRKADLLPLLLKAQEDVCVLWERLKIAEARQRHLEVELAQSRVSIASWKEKARFANSLAVSAQDVADLPQELLRELSAPARALVTVGPSATTTVCTLHAPDVIGVMP